jgi:hypothetical protein
MTTEDMCKTLIKPATAEKQCSYAELLMSDPEAARRYVGKATVFVSHAWRYKFVDLVNTVAAYERDEKPGAFFWIDFIPNNQHTAIARPYDNNRGQGGKGQGGTFKKLARKV